MDAKGRVRALIYDRRRFAKQVLAATCRVLPPWAAGPLRNLAERAVFCLTPAYQGETLPPIFHYWSGRHVGPKLQRIGATSPEDLYFRQTLSAAHGGTVAVASLGAGACALELDLARRLREHGVRACIECVDLNPALLRRARQRAEAMGIADRMRFTVSDCNRGVAMAAKDVVIVNQFFHHVENLEAVAAGLQATLKQDGVLLTVDVVGRNGHLPWPEVGRIVQAFWSRLAPAKRFDRHYARTCDAYRPVDHAAYSNEGIRAQDIVRCLLDRFDFEVFITYGGAVIPFIERRIGFNFDPDSLPDRVFIDAVSDEDEQLLREGRYPASNMVAVLRHKGWDGARHFDPIGPREHVRMTDEQRARVA